jgi:hypothetical protein
MKPAFAQGKQQNVNTKLQVTANENKENVWLTSTPA